MGKKKRTSATDAAESSGSKETDEIKTLNHEIAKGLNRSRQRMERLRVEVASLATPEQDILARSLIDRLKSLNKQMLVDVADGRSQIYQLQYELESLTADQEVLISIEQEVFATVLYYGFCDAAESWTVAMAAWMQAAVSL